MKATVILLTMLMSYIVACGASAQAVPDAVSYQGKLSDSSGQPVPDGSHAMQFKLYGVATGGTAFWTSTVQTVATTGGVFTTQIQPLSPSVITGMTDVWLEILVEGTALQPRVKLMSVPFAFRAGDLVLPYAGIIASANEAFVVKNTGTGMAGRFENTNVSTTVPALDAQTNGTGPALRAIGATAAELYGKVAVTGLVSIGKASPAWPLDVYTSAYGNAIRAETTSSDGNGVYGIANTGANAYGVYGSASSGIGVRGYSFSNLGVFGTGSAAGVRGEGGTGVKGVGSSGYGVEGEGPTAVKGTGTSVGVVGVHSGTGNYTELGRQTDALHAVAWTGIGGYFQSSASDGVYAESSAANKSGVVAFQSNSGGYAVYGKNTATSNYAFLGGNWCGIYAEAGGTSTIAAAFKGNVRLTSKTTGNIVVELGEGLDYSEGFDVSDRGKITPGTVMVIDEHSPGKLAVSTKAYDTRVAGIVAGAKDLGSGVRLGAGQFDQNVALAGRVYCNVDATRADVRPGCLLTTSERPGYAMKATDYARARGAILGKAMEGLKKGKTGQILVLVTLQ